MCRGRDRRPLPAVRGVLASLRKVLAGDGTDGGRRIARAVGRSAPAALVAALLVATAAAFAYTERLKLTPSPILRTRVDALFSPVCECGTESARIEFRLRRHDRITVTILDKSGHVVRTVVS